MPDWKTGAAPAHATSSQHKRIQGKRKRERSLDAEETDDTAAGSEPAELESGGKAKCSPSDVVRSTVVEGLDAKHSGRRRTWIESRSRPVVVIAPGPKVKTEPSAEVPPPIFGSSATASLDPTFWTDARRTSKRPRRSSSIKSGEFAILTPGAESIAASAVEFGEPDVRAQSDMSMFNHHTPAQWSNPGVESSVVKIRSRRATWYADGKNKRPSVKRIGDTPSSESGSECSTSSSASSSTSRLSFDPSRMLRRQK